MAKKKKTTAEVETTVDVMEAVEVKQPKVVQPKKPSWEIKDRYYYLTDDRSPLTLRIKTKGLYWFDEEKGYEREIEYTRNQKTVFVDEMQGNKVLAHVVFLNGVLMVPKNLQTLQKFLSIYHPGKGILYEEQDDEAVAEYEVNTIELELEAMNAAASMDIDRAEAVMRTELGSSVDSMSSKELKRDLLVFAKKNPSLFLELMNDDNVHLRNIGIKANEMGIVKLSGDNRTFSWGSTGRKLMTVPFDEHPYSALAAWFKTDEGMEIYQNIEKRLK